MCGIYGAIGFRECDYVEEMGRVMFHRGPDDNGLWRENEVYLGNTRLAIIDTSHAGHQPMSNENGTIWISFNGEIYNFKKLKFELETRGHRFKSNTDTEVLVHLYEEYGEDCLRYLRGMFSFAIWDRRRKRLFAARDRLGIKPFFYFHKGNKFIFASELKAILVSKLVNRELDFEAVRGYFAFGSIQAPKTIIKDVSQLMPAHYLIFEKGRLELNEYWKIGSQEFLNSKKEKSEYILEIKATLEESVKARMISDVPLGCFLSGGIDSSVIACLMQKHSSMPIRTFSIIFEEEEYDEHRFSAKIAETLGTEHRQILLKEKNVLDELPLIFGAMDQPSNDGFNTFVISRAIRKEGVTVALSGLGGDELFAGYPCFRTLPKINNLIKLIKWIPKHARKGMFNRLNRYAYTKKVSKSLFALFECTDLNDLHALQRMVFLPDEIDGLLTDKIALQSQEFTQGQFDGLDAVNFISFLELSGYLRNTLLADTDHMSMANSLEVRVPFLDHILVEKIFEVPGNMKIGNTYPKGLLVKSVNGLLPEQIYNRPKMGFVFPFENWLKNELKGYCSEKFSEKNLSKIPVLNTKKANKVWTDFLSESKRYNYSSILTLLSFINWYEDNA